MTSTSAFSSEDDVTKKRIDSISRSATEANKLPELYELDRCCGWIREKGFQRVRLRRMKGCLCLWDLETWTCPGVIVHTMYGFLLSGTQATNEQWQWPPPPELILPKVSKRPGLKVNRKKKKKGDIVLAAVMIHTAYIYWSSRLSFTFWLLWTKLCCEQNYYSWSVWHLTESIALFLYSFWSVFLAALCNFDIKGI